MRTLCGGARGGCGPSGADAGRQCTTTAAAGATAVPQRQGTQHDARTWARAHKLGQLRSHCGGAQRRTPPHQSIGAAALRRTTPCLAHAFRKHRQQQAQPQQQQLQQQQQQGKRKDAVPVQILVTCHPGLEAAVASQLERHCTGATALELHHGGVSFTSADVAPAYNACLWLRSGVRVLRLLAHAPLDLEHPAGDAIYALTRASVRWRDHVRRGQTLSVDADLWGCATCTSSLLLKRRVRDAVCDAVKDACGHRPPPPEPPRSGTTRWGWSADVPLYVRLHADQLWLYKDMCGGSLHRRGYGHGATHKTPLNAAVAAGVLEVAGWADKCLQRQEGDDRTAPPLLVDPMCGSGTLLIEAALVGTNTAPGLLRRHWPFIGWIDFDAQLWQGCVEEAQAAARPWRGTVLGNDCDAGALAIARQHAAMAGVDQHIGFRLGDCEQWLPHFKPATVVTNPPWGMRLGGEAAAAAAEAHHTAAASPSTHRRNSPDRDDHSVLDVHGAQTRGTGVVRPAEEDATQHKSARLAWRKLSKFLKGRCQGGVAYVVSGNRALTPELHLKSSAQWPITVGGTAVKLFRYDIRTDAERTDAAAHTSHTPGYEDDLSSLRALKNVFADGGTRKQESHRAM